MTSFASTSAPWTPDGLQASTGSSFSQAINAIDTMNESAISFMGPRAVQIVFSLKFP